jgi:hypothetical protein
MRRFYLLFSFLFSTAFLEVQAQLAFNDTDFYRQSVGNLKDFYRSTVGEGLHLYNGTEYLQYSFLVKGYPFFYTDSFIRGNVYYDGRLYRDVPMRYDLVNDEVIVADFYGNFPIRLVSNKIDYFELAKHQFVRFSFDDTSTSVINNVGFFDEIYKSTFAGVYVKRQKELEMLLGTETDKRNYKQYNRCYILMKNQFYLIDDQRDLLSVLKDKKDAVKKFIRKENIHFKKEIDFAVKTIIEYYITLKD